MTEGPLRAPDIAVERKPRLPAILRRMALLGAARFRFPVDPQARPIPVSWRTFSARGRNAGAKHLSSSGTAGCIAGQMKKAARLHLQTRGLSIPFGAR